MAEPGLPMRKLFLLRHAKSCWDDPSLSDADRPLNRRGRNAAELIAALIADRGLRPALVLVSSSLRTRQTWEAIAPALPGVAVSIEPGLHAARRDEIMSRLRRLDAALDSVMVIAHNPGLERLADSLVEDSGEPEALARLAAKFPTAALAEIDLDIPDWSALDDGTGTLLTFTRPIDLGSPPGE